MTRPVVGILSAVNRKNANQKNTLHANAWFVGTTAGFVGKNAGFAYAVTNTASQTAIFPITGLKDGDVINAFRLIGSVGATTGATTTVDADLRVNTGAADVPTDASIGAITQVSKVANYALNETKSGLTTVVATNKMYYVLVTVSTANNAASDASIMGIEVDVNQ